MNTKTMSPNLILLVLFLLTACAGLETVETILPTEPEAKVEVPPVVDQVEEKVQDESIEPQTPSTAQEETPSLEELSVITSQNAHVLNQIYKLDKVIKDFAWSPDGKMIAFVTTHRIFLFDTETFEEIKLATSESYFSYSHISFSPNGDLIAVSNKGNPKSRVEIYNIHSRDRVMTLDIPEEGSSAVSLAFIPDSNLLAVATGSTFRLDPTGGIKVWDLVSGELIEDLGHDDDVQMKCLCFNKDGNLLATISEAGIVYIWDMNTMQVIEHFWGSSDYHYSSTISYSPDDKILAIGGMESAKGSVKLIDSKTKNTLYDLTLDGYDFVISLAFNPAGDVLASASYDSPWSAGDELASASYDSVRLWNTRTGQPLAVMDVKSATRVAFNPDGTILATGGGDLLRLWGTSETAANAGDTEVALLSPRDALSSAEIIQRADAFNAIITANREAHNAKDAEAVEALFTEDVHFDDYTFGDHLVGIKGLMDMTKLMIKYFPNFQWRDNYYAIGSNEIITIGEFWGASWVKTKYPEEDPFIHPFLFTIQGDLISSFRLFYGYDFLNENDLLSESEATEMEAILTTYASAWSSNDVEIVAGMYAEGSLRQDTLFAKSQKGIEAIKSFAESFFNWYPYAQWSPLEMFGEKRFEGKPQTIGSSYGIQTTSPTGETCEIMAVVLLQVLDGKIIQEDLYYEPDSLIQCGWAQ